MGDGMYTAAVHLNTPEDAVRYCQLQMMIQYEVMIVDDDDYAVLHAKEGRIIFPQANVRYKKVIKIER